MKFKCKKEILIPPNKFIKCNFSDEYKTQIEVDSCIANEVKDLWRFGIHTTGCCCGHGQHVGFIEVVDDDIPRMEMLGYCRYIYPEEFGGVERKDAFIPKSYGHKYSKFENTIEDEAALVKSINKQWNELVAVTTHKSGNFTEEHKKLVRLIERAEKLGYSQEQITYMCVDPKRLNLFM